MSSRSKGPPKHQNRTAWKANAGVKKKDKELGGKLHPYPEVTGVCPRCKAQIEWRRKYGKYKPLMEPTKCNQCSRRAVRQAYHALCSGCSQERKVCAKCCQPSEIIIGDNADKEREEQQTLDQALRNLREREKRTLLRAMNKETKDEKVKQKPTGNEAACKDKQKMDEESEEEVDDWSSEGGFGSSDSLEDGSDDNISQV